MKRNIKYIKVIIITLLLASCSEPNIQYAKTQTPKFNIKDFFRGKIIASGIIQNWRGEVTKTFTAKVTSHWNDNNVIITQNITFNNASTLNRKIQMTLINDNSLLIDGIDIDGTGTGKQSGNAVSFSYNLLIPYMKREVSLSTTEWLYMLPDNSVIANISLRKFGIKVGEVIIYMKKISEN